MTETVRVDLAGRGYDIEIGAGLLADAGPRIRRVAGVRRLIVISDENVAALHLDTLKASLDSAGLTADFMILPAGEQAKDFQRFPGYIERVLDFGVDRKSLIVAFGGGVIGDLAGFIAATVLRGVDFIQIPTTLLAQIDSSVGGKTGANTSQGKNLVGAFHQPCLVLADLAVLPTLPRRELLAGYAEMVKYGALGDAGFFASLERDAVRILEFDQVLLGRAVAHCCGMKAAVVGEDEREAGSRALLNLGHTFGHALEAETGFGATLLHGEAVAIGMALAADLSVRQGRIRPEDALRIRRHLDAVGLPSRLDQIKGNPFSAARLVAHMDHDKKTENGKLTFIVLAALGHAVIEKNVDRAAVLDVLAAAGAVA